MHERAVQVISSIRLLTIERKKVRPFSVSPNFHVVSEITQSNTFDRKRSLFRAPKSKVRDGGIMTDLTRSI